MPINSAFSTLSARAARNSQGTVKVRDWANGTANKTSGTIFSDSVSAAANDLIVVMVAWDYDPGSPITISSVTDTKGTTYTSMGALVSLASSGDGVATQAFFGRVGGSVTATNTTISVTFSASVTAKVIQAASFQDAVPTQVNTRTTTTGTNSGPASFTTPIANTGDLVLVFAGWENNTLPTAGATDTTRGSWSSVIKAGTTGASAASNIVLGAQYKIVNGQGAQSGTLTGAASDWTAQAFAIKARQEKLMQDFEPEIDPDLFDEEFEDEEFEDFDEDALDEEELEEKKQ